MALPPGGAVVACQERAFFVGAVGGIRGPVPRPASGGGFRYYPRHWGIVAPGRHHFRIALDFHRLGCQLTPERFQLVGADIQLMGGAVLPAGGLMLFFRDLMLSFGQIEAVRRFLEKLFG